MDVVKTKAFK